MADKRLDVYLNDHLAGAMFGSDLARQLARRADGTPAQRRMRALADDVEADRVTLTVVMGRLGTPRNRAKQASTWLAEKASRGKLAGLGAGGPALGWFLALETLSLGVEGKRSLWVSLGEVADRYPTLTGVDFAELADRAQRQRALLERERAAAAARAFTGGTGVRAAA